MVLLHRGVALLQRRDRLCMYHTIPGTLVSAPLCRGIAFTYISIDTCLLAFVLLGNERCEFEHDVSSIAVTREV